LNINDIELNASIQSYHQRNGMAFAIVGGYSLKYFKRMKYEKYIYYSQHHLSSAGTRYKRSVSTCLICINDQ
jgi:hypothetical protein